MKLLEVFNIINESQFLIERDVMNAKELKQWSKEQAQRVQNPPEQNWLASQLFKYLINRYDNYEPVTSFNDGAPEWLQAKIAAGEPVIWIVPNDELNAQIQGVVDWLNAEPNNNLRMSWEEAVQAQAEWHRDMARQSKVTELTDEQMEGIVTLVKYQNGYRWVDVQTEVCLQHEGTLMGHCVGQGGYIEGVKEGTTKIISLRDENNNPHATIEGVSDNPILIPKDFSVENPQLQLFDNAVRQSFVNLSIHQIKGKENKPVVRKYRDYVQDFLTKFGITQFGYGGLADLENSGLFKLKRGGFIPVEEIGETVSEMDDGTSWHRVDNEYVDLDDVNAKWFLQDQTGRGIGTLIEGRRGQITHINFASVIGYNQSVEQKEKYKDHIITAFSSKYDKGRDVIKPNSSLYHGFHNTMEGFGLAVVDGKVNEPQTIGVHKMKTSAGDIYATEWGAGIGDMYWLMKGDNIQARFALRSGADEGGMILTFDENRGLPSGSMLNFIKKVEEMFPGADPGLPYDHVLKIGAIQVHGRVLSVSDIEYKDYEGNDELVMEEDGVKFYASGKDMGGSTWYNAVDSHGHHIFNMSIGDATFKLRLVNKKVAGFYAIYLLEHLYESGEEDFELDDYRTYSSFAREFLDETEWFMSQYDSDWYYMDDNYPIELTINRWEGEDEAEDTEETTIKEYWERTGLGDSGLEEDYFAGEYEELYRGHSIHWDDDYEGDDGTYIRNEYSAVGKGDPKTVMHPISGGTVRVKK